MTASSARNDALFLDQSTGNIVTVDVVFWPTSLLSNHGIDGTSDNDTRGCFVVGWSLAATTGPFSYKSFIVVGIIPHNDALDYSTLLSSIRRSLQKLREHTRIGEYESKYPCCQDGHDTTTTTFASSSTIGTTVTSATITSSTANDSSHCCGKCINRSFFDPLSVLAYAVTDHKNSIHGSLDGDSSRTNRSTLPQILISSETGRPVVSPVSSMMRWKQLILYPDVISSPRKDWLDLILRSMVIEPVGLLYPIRSRDGLKEESFFADEILIRLTHARFVMNQLQRMQGKQQVLSTPVQSIVMEEETRSSSTSLRQPQKLESHPIWRIYEGILRWTARYSMVSRHLRTTRLSPFITLVTKLMEYRSKKLTMEEYSVNFSDCYVLNESHYDQIDRITAFIDQLVTALWDTASGVVVGIILTWLLSSETTTNLLAGALARYHEALCKWLLWLERFPIGFKLNVRLTEVIGVELRSCITIHQLLWEKLLLWIIAHRRLACTIIFLTSSCLGLSGTLALFCDAWSLFSFHVSIMAAILRYVYSMEMHLLRSLASLFRGKKRNILRRRIDTMEYDSMQLLVGTLWFTVALFMFTTILVYHVFLSVLHLASMGMTGLILFCYMNINRFPWGKVLLLFTHNHWFATSVYLDDQLIIDGLFAVADSNQDSTVASLAYSSPSVFCTISDAINPSFQSGYVLLWTTATNCIFPWWRSSVAETANTWHLPFSPDLDTTMKGTVCVS